MNTNISNIIVDGNKDLTPYCSTLTSSPSFLQFAFNKILNLVNFLLLLVQEIQDDTHGGLLQPNTLHLILQSILDVAQSQRGMNQNYCRNKKTIINK